MTDYILPGRVLMTARNLQGLKALLALCVLAGMLGAVGNNKGT